MHDYSTNYVNPDYIYSLPSDSRAYKLISSVDGDVLMRSVHKGKGIVAHHIGKELDEYLWLKYSPERSDFPSKKYFIGPFDLHYPDVTIYRVYEDSEYFIIKEFSLTFNIKGIFCLNGSKYFRQSTEDELLMDERFDEEYPEFPDYKHVLRCTTKIRKKISKGFSNNVEIDLLESYNCRVLDTGTVLLLYNSDEILVLNIKEKSYYYELPITNLLSVHKYNDNIIFVLNEEDFIIFNSIRKIKKYLKYSHENNFNFLNGFIIFKKDVFDIESNSLIARDMPIQLLKTNDFDLEIKGCHFILIQKKTPFRFALNLMGSQSWRILGYDPKSFKLCLTLFNQGIKTNVSYNLANPIRSIPFHLARYRTNELVCFTEDCAWLFPLNFNFDDENFYNTQSPVVRWFNKLTPEFDQTGFEIQNIEFQDKHFFITAIEKSVESKIRYGYSLSEIERGVSEEDDYEIPDVTWEEERIDIHYFLGNFNEYTQIELKEVTEIECEDEFYIGIEDYENLVTFRSNCLYFWNKNLNELNEKQLLMVDSATGKVSLLDKIPPEFDYVPIAQRDFLVFASVTQDLLRVLTLGRQDLDIKIEIDNREKSFLNSLRIKSKLCDEKYPEAYSSILDRMDSDKSTPYINSDFATLKGFPVIFYFPNSKNRFYFQLMPGILFDEKKKIYEKLSDDVILDAIEVCQFRDEKPIVNYLIFIDQSQKVQLYHLKSRMVIRTVIDLKKFSGVNLEVNFFRNIYQYDDFLLIVGIDRKTFSMVSISDILSF